MDADKLNKAIYEYARMCSVDIEGYEAIKQAVRYGIELTMQQPLADRLTDEEKEKIKEIFKRANDSYVANDSLNTPRTSTETHSRGYDVGVMSVIEDIFGKELFNEK